jgi:NAD(P)H-nitrite reductase large subunit
MEGLDSVPRTFSFMTLDDALALEGATDKTSRVFIVGAGLIGLKCAEGLCGRVAEITVCDLADRVLSSILDAECAGMVQKHLEKHGIRFLLGDSVRQFKGGTAQMKSGAVVDYDVLVLAVGVRANTGLLREIGGEVGRGIAVNGRMETSVPGIWAAGDCTESEDISCGTRRVLAILPNAVMQGRTAGVNMAGGEAAFDCAIPMNSIGFFGLHIMTARTHDGDMYEEKTEGSVKRLFTKDDRLLGFIFVGCEERAGIYTAMIREKTPLSSVNFDILKKKATTFAFSREIRRKKFEGMV